MRGDYLLSRDKPDGHLPLSLPLVLPLPFPLAPLSSIAVVVVVVAVVVVAVVVVASPRDDGCALEYSQAHPCSYDLSLLSLAWTRCNDNPAPAPAPDPDPDYNYTRDPDYTPDPGPGPALVLSWLLSCEGKYIREEKDGGG